MKKRSVFPIIFIIMAVLTLISGVYAEDGKWVVSKTGAGDFYGIWGSSGTDIFVVGDSGVILHYDGATWIQMASSTDRDLTSVWGSSGSDVFAVGYRGTILHYDGAAWSQMNSSTDVHFYRIWESSGNNVFAVGDSGTILHYDGASWSHMETGIKVPLRGLWGSSGADVFAVGGDRYSTSILHFDGTAWTQMESAMDSPLESVWGTSGTSVFAGDLYNGIQHYDGRNWSIMKGGTYPLPVTGMWGSSGNDVFATGGPIGEILHYDGMEWNEIDIGVSESIKDAWGHPVENRPGFDVFAVGSGGAVLHYDGVEWTRMETPLGNKVMPLTNVWGSSDSDIFAIGWNGEILHYDGTEWTGMNSGTDQQLLGAWGYPAENRPGSNVFAVGYRGVILHYNGTEWSLMDNSAEAWFTAVWGSSENNVFAVGDYGAILHYDGTEWTPMDSGTDISLYGVWGSSGDDIFAVGGESYAGGLILHYDGTAWTPMDSGTTQILYDVWGSSGNDVFAVGRFGSIQHYDGAEWTSMDSGTELDVNGVWGSSGLDVFAVTGNERSGAILHYDGTAWTPMDSGTYNKGFNDVWGSSGSSVFVAGGDWSTSGTILSYSTLALILPGKATEGDGTPVQGEVRVKEAPGTDLVINLVINLVSSDISEVSVPETVIIPRGNQSVSFELLISDDTLLDGSQTITVTGSAPGYNTGKGFIRVDDNETAVLAVNVPQNATEGDGRLPEQGVVSISAPAGKDVTVLLHSDDTGEARVPKEVIIQAGQSEALFNIIIADDAKIDDIQAATITASVEGWISGSAAIEVKDNDRYVLIITVPGITDEKDGILAHAGTVSLSEACPSDVYIDLSSDDTSELIVPGTVVIPAGDMSASFNLTLLEDATVDGTQVVAIRASAPDWTSGSAVIEVTDADGDWTTIRRTDMLNGIWGSSMSDIFAVGGFLFSPGQTILHYDGTTWTQEISNTEMPLYDVWGRSGDNVFAVGKSGTIKHYNGADWTYMESGVEEWLCGIWGISGNNIFAVGEWGVILHYDGAGWSLMETGIYDDISDVWGSSGNNVFAVGGYADYVILHYDGENWSLMETGAYSLKGVWGSSGDDVFAVGEFGLILHYDGKSWSEMESGTGETLQKVWGTSGSDVFAVGHSGIILYYDGKEWTQMDSGTDNPFWNVWGQAGNRTDPGIFAVGSKGMIMRFDGAEWQQEDIPEEWVNFTDVWGAGAEIGSGPDLFAVGHAGKIMHYDGLNWHKMGTGTDWGMNLNGIWGRTGANSGLDMFAVGESGTILRYKGNEWHKIENITDSQLHDAWGTPDGSSPEPGLFAVGDSGIILFYDYMTWTRMDSGINMPLYGIWGSSGSDVFAVGEMGTILHYDGAKWSTMESPCEEILRSVWGTSGSDIFAVGGDWGSGTILHYDGLKWTEIYSGLYSPLNRVWGSSGSDVFIVGGFATIFHYDGIDWTEMITQYKYSSSSPYNGAWGSSGSDVFIVGEYSLVLRYSTIMLTLPEIASEGDGILAGMGTVSVGKAPGSDLTVKLRSDDPSEITVPSSVTIPAGQHSAVFDLAIMEDSLSDGSQTVTVIAFTPENKALKSRKCVVRVDDNETAALTVTLPQIAAEGDQMLPEQGFAGISETAGKDVTVFLSTDDAGELRVPEKVIIPAGETGAAFDIIIPDDNEFDNTQTIVVTASVKGWTPGSAVIDITDNEIPELSVTIPTEAYESDGILPDAGTVSIPGTLGSDLTVGLLSSDMSELAVPETIVIPAGEIYAVFDITLVDDSEIDNAQAATVSASAEGWTSAEAVVQVNDNDPGILQFSADRYMALASEGEIIAAVIRTGSSSGEISVEYTVENLEGLTGTLIFADNETSRTFAIATEDLRGFQNPAGLSHALNLASPGGGATIGNPGTALLIIAESAAWQPLEIPTEHPVRDIWGVSHSDIFAAGWGGVILHYNGAEWTEMSTDMGKTVYLEGVWGASSSDVFAAGQKGVIMHYDGKTWIPMEAGTDSNLYGIWGSSPSDVFAAGTHVILHYDGAEWHKTNTGADKTDIGADLRAIWGSSASDIFAAGTEGTVLHYDGTSWTRMETGVNANLYGIWGRSPSDVYAVGSFGTVLHYDGTAWTRMETGIKVPVLFLADIWGTPESDIFATGHNGTVLHYNGKTWNRMETGTEVALKALWGNNALDIFAAGESGTILHYAPE